MSNRQMRNLKFRIIEKLAGDVSDLMGAGMSIPIPGLLPGTIAGGISAPEGKKLHGMAQGTLGGFGYGLLGGLAGSATRRAGPAIAGGLAGTIYGGLRGGRRASIDLLKEKIMSEHDSKVRLELQKQLAQRQKNWL